MESTFKPKFSASTTRLSVSATALNELSATPFAHATPTTTELFSATALNELSTTFIAHAVPITTELFSVTAIKLSSTITVLTYITWRTEQSCYKCFISPFWWRSIKKTLKVFFLITYLNNRQRKTNV